MNTYAGTLLLVDDKPENIITLEAVLSGLGYRLLVAHSGAEAISLLQKDSADVIVLDVQMPGMDGYETARRIQAMESYKNVPIIFITATFSEDPFVRKGFAAGGLDYFTKPFDPEIFKKKVSIYTSLRQKERLLEEKDKRIRELEEMLKHHPAAKH